MLALNIHRKNLYFVIQDGQPKKVVGVKPNASAKGSPVVLLKKRRGGGVKFEFAHKTLAELQAGTAGVPIGRISNGSPKSASRDASDNGHLDGSVIYQVTILT